ncbi:MAG: GNAT family N-acetyltransferase [Acidimicrobiales bacterium]|jgi:GNAT superfamily N-acetyltransferase
MTPPVRKATRTDINPAGDVLAAAMAADPIACWILGKETDVERRLRLVFRGLIRVATRASDHEVYLTDDGWTVGLWHGVGRWDLQPMDLMRVFLSSLRSGFLNRRGLQLTNAMHKAHPREPHYYLEVLGTRPDRQGHGGGSAVMTVMAERCDREGVAAYLENSNPRNDLFYRRHGFELMPAFGLPAGCPPLVPMWREPR